MCPGTLVSLGLSDFARIWSLGICILIVLALFAQSPGAQHESMAQLLFDLLDMNAKPICNLRLFEKLDMAHGEDLAASRRQRRHRIVQAVQFAAACSMGFGRRRVVGDIVGTISVHQPAGPSLLLAHGFRAKIAGDAMNERLHIGYPASLDRGYCPQESFLHYVGRLHGRAHAFSHAGQKSGAMPGKQ